MRTLSRRRFLGTSAACGVTMALAPRFVFAEPSSSSRTVVLVSLRGGMDGLSAVVPVEAGYFDRRPTIAVPETELLELDGRFGLHPALAPLHEVWQDGRLALVPAVGTPTGSRSHFAERDMIDQGVGELSSTVRSGWLARHLASRPGGPGVGLSAAAISGALPQSLVGDPSAAAMSNIASFAVRGIRYRDRDRVHAALDSLYADDGVDARIAEQAAGTIAVIELLRASAPGDIPPDPAAEYANDGWSRSLRQVGQLVRADIGLEVAAVDFGGWDTHADMGTTRGGRMQSQLTRLGGALGAFLTDIASMSRPVTVVVISEFGRRVAENASRGLDHGRGGTVMVAGSGVSPGVHGPWPGLADGVLDRGDVPTATDYRDVLAEVVGDLLGNPALDEVLPGHRPRAVGTIAT